MPDNQCYKHIVIIDSINFCFTAGVDFVPLLPSSSKVSFSGTTKSGRIPVQIISDNVTESVEVFDVHITGIDLLNATGVEQVLTDKDQERIIFGQSHARVFISDGNAVRLLATLSY